VIAQAGFTIDARVDVRGVDRRRKGGSVGVHDRLRSDLGSVRSNSTRWISKVRTRTATPTKAAPSGENSRLAASHPAHPQPSDRSGDARRPTRGSVRRTPPPIAAATAARLGKAVQNVDVAALQARLRAQKQVVDFIPGLPEQEHQHLEISFVCSRDRLLHALEILIRGQGSVGEQDDPRAPCSLAACGID